MSPTLVRCHSRRTTASASSTSGRELLQVAPGRLRAAYVVEEQEVEQEERLRQSSSTTESSSALLRLPDETAAEYLDASARRGLPWWSAPEDPEDLHCAADSSAARRYSSASSAALRCASSCVARPFTRSHSGSNLAFPMFLAASAFFLASSATRTARSCAASFFCSATARCQSAAPSASSSAIRCFSSAFCQSAFRCASSCALRIRSASSAALMRSASCV
mmetsp:Transcript_44324/g.131271  ORF Transcript_44324/g.131271 Transcript_44324/m.131271 type:complete len:221 (+) Transcript_44324:708-1370(+)